MPDIIIALIFILVVILVFIAFLTISTSDIFIIWLKMDLYFLQLNIENHPVLKKMVDDTIEEILNEEGIKTFHKSYEELNKDEKDEDKKALGKYVYTIDTEHQKRLKERLIDIISLEKKHNQSYEKMCEEIGLVPSLTKEQLTLPRILICNDKLMEYGMNGYYSTYFHEIGHHFAVKNIGEHTEKDADKFASKIILERLPYFFQLFPQFRFMYRLELPELTLSEKKRAYYDYWRYYRKYKHTIIEPNKK